MASDAIRSGGVGLEAVVHTLSWIDIGAIGRAFGMEVGACAASDGEGRDGSEVTLDDALQYNLTIRERKGIEALESTLAGKASRTGIDVVRADSADDRLVGRVRGREIGLIASARGVGSANLGAEHIRGVKDGVAEGISVA
jgi:hypothetical protein